MVRALVEAGAGVNAVCSSGDDELLPLHVAVLYHKQHLVNILIKLGADVNLPTRLSGFTTLQLAVIEECNEAARWLLKAGGDPLVEGAGAASAWHEAANRGLSNVLRLFVMDGLVDVDAPSRERQLLKWTVMASYSLTHFYLLANILSLGFLRLCIALPRLTNRMLFGNCSDLVPILTPAAALEKLRLRSQKLREVLHRSQC